MCKVAKTAQNKLEMQEGSTEDRNTHNEQFVARPYVGVNFCTSFHGTRQSLDIRKIEAFGGRGNSEELAKNGSPKELIA